MLIKFIYILNVLMKQNINFRLINEKVKTYKHFNGSKAFIEYSNVMDDIYKNIEEYNSNKKHRILIVFDDMIADMLSSKKLKPIGTELFIRGRKLNISLALIMQSYFKVTKDVRQNTMHFFIMKIPNKWEFQQIAFNHSSDIEFRFFESL